MVRGYIRHAQFGIFGVCLANEHARPPLDVTYTCSTPTDPVSSTRSRRVFPWVRPSRTKFLPRFFRSCIVARVLRLSRAFLGVASLLATSLSFADEPTVEQPVTKPSIGEGDEVRFHALVKDAVRAVNDGRLNDAVKAYNAALDIRSDPLIAGRLGLILAMFDAPSNQVAAAINLYRAISEHAGTSRSERKTFFDAFDLAQTRICRVDITTSDVNSFVQIDDEEPHKSNGAFWHYIEPGIHEIIGTLEGRDSIRKTVECPKGKKIEVYLNFPGGVTEVKTVEKVRDRMVFVESPSPMSNADQISRSDTPKHARLKFDAGPAMVFGVAPTPAFGVSLSSLYDFGNIAVNLTTRAVYAIEPFNGQPLDRFSFSALAGPCKTWGWFRACGFAGINLIKSRVTVSVPDDFYTTGQAVPGFGIGIGTRHSFGRRLRLYANGDAMILTEATEATVYRSSRTYKLWSGSPFLASLSLGIEFAR